MKFIWPLLGCLGTAIQPAIASPEHPWLLDLHAGLSGSSAGIGDVDTDLGFELGGSIAYHFMDNRVGPYFGWSVNGYEAASDTFPDLETVIYSRISLGISYQDLNLDGSRGFYVRAGLTSGRIRLEDDADEELAESDSGTGFETAAGLTFDLKGNWRLRTGVIYSSLSEDLDGVSGDSDADIDAFSADIGWSLAF